MCIYIIYINCVCVYIKKHYHLIILNKINVENSCTA